MSIQLHFILRIYACQNYIYVDTRDLAGRNNGTVLPRVTNRKPEILKLSNYRSRNIEPTGQVLNTHSTHLNTFSKL